MEGLKVDNKEYIYDKTEVRVIGNKKFNVRVRANKPSEGALDNHAKTIYKLMMQLKKEGRL